MTLFFRHLLLGAVAFATMSTGCRRPVGAPLPPRTTCRNTVIGLGPRDVLTVTVFNEANLTGEYRVGEDGTITFPYLGRVRVTGMQAGELSDMFRSRLGERSQDNPEGGNILRDPTVRVEVREINSRRISIFGQVQHPGVFPHQQCITLTQAISLAGGFTAIADKNIVRVTRIDRDGQRRTFVLRAEDIAEGRAPDFDLLPDDVIFVAESLT
jgi:protein involved in polysaccharide export with SLBB domain